MTYTVTGAEPKDTIDWVAVGKPEEIVIPDGHTEAIRFVGIAASESDPVIIHGGDVMVPLANSYALKFDGCQYFILRDTKTKGGHLGLTFEKRTSDFKLINLEVAGTGFAGIMAKDNEAKRGEFTMQNVVIHDCYVHDTGLTKTATGKYEGEGMYIGSTSLLGHDLRNIHISFNRILNTKWDGLQLGQGVEGCYINNNRIENYGLANEPEQNNGIQIGNRTGGYCFENTILRGTGNGIICLGDATNVVSDNYIIEAGGNGIFCDDRESIGKGFTFERNIIVSPKLDCIKIMANKGLLNSIHFNRLIRPGSFGKVGHSDPFINKGADMLIDDYENQRSMDKDLATFLIRKYS